MCDSAGCTQRGLGLTHHVRQVGAPVELGVGLNQVAPLVRVAAVSGAGSGGQPGLANRHEEAAGVPANKGRSRAALWPCQPACGGRPQAPRGRSRACPCNAGFEPPPPPRSPPNPPPVDGGCDGGQLGDQVHAVLKHRLPVPVCVCVVVVLVGGGLRAWGNEVGGGCRRKRLAAKKGLEQNHGELPRQPPGQAAQHAEGRGTPRQPTGACVRASGPGALTWTCGCPPGRPWQTCCPPGRRGGIHRWVDHPREKYMGSTPNVHQGGQGGPADVCWLRLCCRLPTTAAGSILRPSTHSRIKQSRGPR